ncbi:MAG: MBL fold metallo-hydrolase, partial [Mailhella sp.]|nr:MBL fold metallo-hydrolase [Mailhella sp.]
AIALTHLHCDHCLGCAEMSKATGLVPLIGLEDWLERGLLLCKGMCFGMELKPFQAEPLTEGEITWGSLNCKVIHTPGHSPGSLCYYFEDLGILITGDLLFFRSVGRSDLPLGDGETLVRSLREKIYTLPGAVAVYPGHGPETSVGYEAIHNHFCRA